MFSPRSCRRQKAIAADNAAEKEIIGSIFLPHEFIQIARTVCSRTLYLNILNKNSYVHGTIDF